MTEANIVCVTKQQFKARCQGYGFEYCKNAFAAGWFFRDNRSKGKSGNCALQVKTSWSIVLTDMSVVLPIGIIICGAGCDHDLAVLLSDDRCGSGKTR